MTNAGTSLAAAAGNHLGLEFDAAREMLDVLVIDEAMMPAPD